MRADTREFLTLLDNLSAHPMQECRELFDSETDLFVTRAPGRLDLMGGIADYSGSLVLELPIAEAAFVALQRDTSRKIRIVTLTNDRRREAAFEMSLLGMVWRTSSPRSCLKCAINDRLIKF